jgi:hypothetical protein
VSFEIVKSIVCPAEMAEDFRIMAYSAEFRFERSWPLYSAPHYARCSRWCIAAPPTQQARSSEMFSVSFVFSEPSPMHKMLQARS